MNTYHNAKTVRAALKDNCFNVYFRGVGMPYPLRVTNVKTTNKNLFVMVLNRNGWHHVEEGDSLWQA